MVAGVCKAERIVRSAFFVFTRSDLRLSMQCEIE
jgi:hypothetical protein